MADVVRSHSIDPKSLQLSLANIVRNANLTYEDEILSPLTITLGDEFQGVVDNEATGIRLIFLFEEHLAGEGFPFYLRYVLGRGEIGTGINRQIAHGMLGSGLTSVRKELEELKKVKARFRMINTHPEDITKALNNSWLLYQTLISDWHRKDKDHLKEFFHEADYRKVANILNMHPSSVWRKYQSLQMDAYFAAKELILYLNSYAHKNCLSDSSVHRW